MPSLRGDDSFANMTSVIVGPNGEIALPGELRARYGLESKIPVRVIETRNGILLVPLTDAPMTPELVKELAEWQSLGADSWETFDYQDESQ